LRRWEILDHQRQVPQPNDLLEDRDAPFVLSEATTQETAVMGTSTTSRTGEPQGKKIGQFGMKTTADPGRHHG
jgi:hypothetical protein